MTTRQLLFKRPIPTGWRVLKVDELKADEPSSCSAGPFGSNISSKYFVDNGIPIIRGSNLRDDLTRFVPEGFVFVSEERATHYKGQRVRAGDLVFTCWGTLGQVGIIPSTGPFPEYIISNKQLKLRPNSRIANPLYLFYYFACPEMVKHIQSIAIGAAVPGINLGILKNLDVTLPPLPVQERIVSILSAYDDLIENNTRRIAILEEMARAIYREWFVNFRFPGHEKMKLIDSRLGKIPEGWKLLEVGDLCSMVRAGGTPRRDEPTFWNDGTVDWYKTKELQDGFLFESEEKISELAATTSTTRLFDADTLLMAIYGSPTVGRLGILTKRAACNQAALAMTPKTDTASLPFLFHVLMGLREHFNTIAMGAAQQNISKEKVIRAKCVGPSRDLIALFDAHTEPVLYLIRNLSKKNNRLRFARDLLLPKLISGQLDVEELDIETGEPLVEAEA